jgi:hypothetical protein
MSSLTILNAPEQLAVILIAASGVALIVQQHAIAWRLFVAGCITGIAAPFISQHSGFGLAGTVSIIAGWIAITALCAALLGVRRWPLCVALWAGTVWSIAPLLATSVQSLLHYWWVIPVALCVPLLAAFLSATALKSVRGRVYGWNPKSGMSRFVARLLNRPFGARGAQRRRRRHVSDFGVTRRGRTGRGPHAI